MHPKKTITIVSAVVILLFVYYAGNVSPVVSDETYTYIAGLSWYKNYDEGQKAAIEEDKPMLVYFWATWCEFCKKLETEVYPNTQVNKILEEDFVLVAINIDDNKKDADAFGVWVPPNEKFITPQGEVMDEIGGYMPEDRFLVILRQVKVNYDSRKTG
ncbi:thioredoxin fold domain-containing protein [archaeon]|nr:thioredoxin fold domain-containing protein [archaeon]